jgi:hypothetical protein
VRKAEHFRFVSHTYSREAAFEVLAIVTEWATVVLAGAGLSAPVTVLFGCVALLLLAINELST